LPRSKPSDCIEYRITLGTKERQQLDSLIVALNFNNITDPFIEVIKDVSAMTVLVSLYLGIRYGEDAVAMLNNQYETVAELLNDTMLINRSLFVAGQTPIPFVGNLNSIFSLFDAFLPGDQNPFDGVESRREGGSSGRGNA
jgi:hypothetical protein